MATTKATKKSSSSTKKDAQKKAPSKTTTTKVTTVSAAASGSTLTSKIEKNTVNIVIAEVLGTFILATVALLSLQDVMPLYIGLALAGIVMVIGNVSGAHVNPAVTFGLWVARKTKGIMVPFYWVAQFIGAMLAFVVVNGVAGSAISLNFDHFSLFEFSIFMVELVGTAIFLFILVGVLDRKDVSAGGKAIGIGLALMVGILVSSAIMDATKQQAIADYQKDAANVTAQDKATEIPHAAFVKGAALNPAVALVSTESTESELTGQSTTKEEAKYTRFTLEVLLGTLAGAAVGALLYRLTTYAIKQ